MDKKLMKYGIIVVAILFVIIIISLLFNSATGGTKLSYEKIEDKLVSAARRYVKNKSKSGIDILPESYLSDSSYISSDVLVSEGYLDDLSSYAKDDTMCVGGVNIYNAGDGNYNYVPLLTCGAYHETVKLVDVVLKDNDNGIIHGSGLYLKMNGKFATTENELNMINSDNFEYVFRGDDVNNYVKIDDNIWRIVSIDSSNNLLLIYNEHSQKSYAWDDKYNESINKYQGVNTFENNGLESTAYKALKEFRNGTLILMNKEKLSDKTNYLTVPMDLCVGKRSVDDKDISGKTECKTILKDQFVGLLPAYSYMSASLDPNCDTITSKSCGNFNYLAQFNDYWWLLTANSENTNEAYAVSKKAVESNLCNYKGNIKPTIKLGGMALYEDGDGSKANPYTIKFYGE